MSATGRSAKRLTLPGLETATGRHPDDFYRTPAWCTRALLRSLTPPLPGARWIDAGAGDGAISSVLAAAWPGVAGVAIEKDEHRAEACRMALMGHSAVQVHCADFLAHEAPEPAEIVISNPPFVHAEGFLGRALALAPTVALLLPVGFFGAACRQKLIKRWPCDLAVLSPRPSFRGGATDSATYAWAIWGPGRGGRWWVSCREPAAPAERKTQQ